MAETSIQWTDHSINPIRARRKSDRRQVGHFCQMTSPGCAHCYSSEMQRRFGTPAFGGEGKLKPLPIIGADGRVSVGDDLEVFLDESKFTEIRRRKKPTKYFWCDMTDLFGSWVPDSWIDACFRTMAETPRHIHQVLTKRADRMRDYVSKRWGTFDGKNYPPLPNVWLGTSVENQAAADERIPILLETPAAVRFLSCEPLLGPVDLRACRYKSPTTPAWSSSALGGVLLGGQRVRCIDWVIAGGESGPGARRCNVDWIRDIVRQCRDASVPCFVKQLGANVVDECEDCTPEHTGWPAEGGPMDWETGRVRLKDKKGGVMEEWPEALRVREWPDTTTAPAGATT